MLRESPGFAIRLAWRARRPAFFLSLVVALASVERSPLVAEVASTSAGSTTIRQARGPIVVAIVVDQLAAWVLRERIDALPANGGFARLRREGKFYQEMAFAHAVTETAPGHASLFTGKVPREHGIIANDVPGPDGKKHATIADASDSAKLVGLDCQPLVGTGSSLAKLDSKDDMVANVFRGLFGEGQGLIAALSLKDRGTLFAAGETADFAIWFDPKQPGGRSDPVERGAFVTTKHYAEALRCGSAGGKPGSSLASFVRSYRVENERRPDARNQNAGDGIRRIEDLAWKPLDPAWLSQQPTVSLDDYSGFADSSHLASLAPKPGSAFRALPGSDRLLLAMALYILKTESRSRPTFVSVSLSANDYVGHMFSPDSWEAWDELRRLDDSLAWFFNELDRFGSKSWSLVLSADHGSVPPEDDPGRPKCGDDVVAAIDSGEPCHGSRVRGDRVFMEDLKQSAIHAADEVGLQDSAGERIRNVIDAAVFPYLYLTKPASAAVRGDASARDLLARTLDGEIRKKLKSVQAIVDVARACPDLKQDPLLTLVCNSVSRRSERGGDFYIVLKPGAFFDPDLIKGSGINHGSPYGYDRLVPMLVRDPKRPDLAGQVEPTRVPFTQFHDELVRIIRAADATAK